MCYTNIPRVGIQWLDLPQEAGTWKARFDYAQLSVKRQADPAERYRRNTVGIKIENEAFFAPQSPETYRGVYFTHNTDKTRPGVL